jgi:hypothetical protein
MQLSLTIMANDREQLSQATAVILLSTRQKEYETNIEQGQFTSSPVPNGLQRIARVGYLSLTIKPIISRPIVQQHSTLD